MKGRSAALRHLWNVWVWNIWIYMSSISRIMIISAHGVPWRNCTAKERCARLAWITLRRTDWRISCSGMRLRLRLIFWNVIPFSNGRRNAAIWRKRRSRCRHGHRCPPGRMTCFIMKRFAASGRRTGNRRRRWFCVGSPSVGLSLW